MIDQRRRLGELVSELALQRGDFTLSSGERSTYYLDCRRVTLSAEGAYLIGELVLAFLRERRVDAIGGLTMGADPIVGATLAAAGRASFPLRGFLVRKEPKGHGTGRLVEGLLDPNDRTLIVEDVSTTGSSALKAADAAVDAGAEMAGVLTLVDRLAGAREAVGARGLSFDSLLTIHDLGIDR